MGGETQTQTLYLEYIDPYGELENQIFENIIFYNVSDTFFQISLANGENYGFATSTVLSFKTYFVTTKE